MSVGVATANSILVVTFANDQRLEGKDARAAAVAAGVNRLRPVHMTALAMIIGMLPMSLGSERGASRTPRSAGRSSAGLSSRPPRPFSLSRSLRLAPHACRSPARGVAPAGNRCGPPALAPPQP